MTNKFKFSSLRQFGTENFSFTAEVESDATVLPEEVITDNIKQIDTAISKAFIACQNREISEMEVLARASEKRTAEIRKRDAQLKEEMTAKEDATKTLKKAESLSNKLTPKN